MYPAWVLPLTASCTDHCDFVRKQRGLTHNTTHWKVIYFRQHVNKFVSTQKKKTPQFPQQQKHSSLHFLFSQTHACMLQYKKNVLPCRHGTQAV